MLTGYVDMGNSLNLRYLCPACDTHTGHTENKTARESIQYIPVHRYVQLGHYVSRVHVQVLIKMKLKIICMCMHTI